jgi:hypothetical protein
MPISAITDYLSTLLFLLTSNPYTMVTYKFKLINSQVPVIKGKNIITDSNVGGIKNTYEIIRISGPFGILRKRIGTKTFLRPYQRVWDVKRHKLPAKYWGKGPFINMWLILNNDYNNIKEVKSFINLTDTMEYCTKILNVDFESRVLVKNLKLNESFKQSKSKTNERIKRLQKR